MPLYEYQCQPHGHRFEVRQSITEDPVTVCTECGGPVRRVIHPVGIVFKGSGFYATDSRKTEESVASKPSTGESKESSKPESNDGAKKESKSDSKKETKSDSSPAS